MKYRSFFLFFLLFTLNNSSSYAIREARPTPIDSRIRVMVYNPNDVFKYTGYYGYQASMIFEEDEEVTSISMGDTTSWQIIPSGNKIFLKPIEDDASTNMTLITNKRTYFFELYAEEIEDMRDPNMVFNIRFLYPDTQDTQILQTYSSESSAPDIEHPENYNFYYSISGDESIAPIKIFDDGQFTYMYFRDKNAEIPAIFSVDEDLKESIVNYRLSPESKNMIVIEQVYPKLSLKLGKKVVCIFNEAYHI